MPQIYSRRRFIFSIIRVYAVAIGLISIIITLGIPDVQAALVALLATNPGLTIPEIFKDLLALNSGIKIFIKFNIFLLFNFTIFVINQNGKKKKKR